MGAGRKNCEEDKDTLASLLFPDTRRAPPQGLFTRCSFLGTRLPGATTLTPGFCQVSAEISPYQRVSHPAPPDSMSTPTLPARTQSDSILLTPLYFSPLHPPYNPREVATIINSIF